ncbi:VOC family protein [Maliponia aquimaris]|uniref:Glyoxalase-like domain-containing protein n=1 Tax=Maliponia aquimaris TaxID=1673631 RepID=A0A238L3C5_9RHOB|nr:VOC family protein [Maliponia aquimaris]SMX49477.1 hypothetical protein MAA8898_04308 [Maliponia aquimaris]
MLELDHIAVLGETLDAAAACATAQLGLPLRPGGRHVRYGTHNRLLGLADGLYLEAIAIDPEAPEPPGPRWFGLDAFAGPARLDKWICRVPDIDAAIAALPGAGRRVDLTRGDLSWSMAVPEDGLLSFDGLFPALIQWHSPVPPGQTLPPSRLRLTRLEVTHPRAGALAELLAPHLADDRLRFVEAAVPRLSASLAGPDGEVSLA